MEMIAAEYSTGAKEEEKKSLVGGEGPGPGVNDEAGGMENILHQD